MSKIKTLCKNCDQLVDDIDTFCSNCGQKIDEGDIRFKYFVKDFVSANFNLDAKIFQTLKLLLFFPIKLTTEFIEGKRTKYIPPIRLYLIISLFYFFIVSLDINRSTSLPPIKVIDNDSITNTIEDENLIDFIADNEEPANDFERIILSKIETLNSDLGSFIFEKKLKENLSKGMFFLLPVIALIFLLLFYKNSYYIHHLVFTIHLQSVIFIIASLALLLEFVFDPKYLISIELIIMYFVTFIWVKKFYKLSLKRTFWKLILFYLMLMILLIIHFSLLLAYSFTLL